MSSDNDILAIAVNGFIAVMLVKVFFSWVAEHDLGGPFSVLIDPLKAISLMVASPSTALLVAAAGMVFAYLPSGDGF